MPLSVKKDAKRGWIIVRAIGTLEIRELIRLIVEVRGTVENQMVPMLFDARKARGPLPMADVESAVAVVRTINERAEARGHVAIAAPDNDVFNGMLHYETRCAAMGVRGIRVFRFLPDAEHWLEIVSSARNLH